jgi:hypothetical protein
MYCHFHGIPSWNYESEFDGWLCQPTFIISGYFSITQSVMMVEAVGVELQQAI